MLDKNTLAKRFEDATKQEIINHNRAIEASNGSILEIKSRSEKIAGKLNEYNNAFSSKISQISDRIDKLNSELDNKIIGLESRMNDFDEIFKVLAEQFNDIQVRTIYLAENQYKLGNSLILNNNKNNSFDIMIKKHAQDFDAKLARIEHVLSDKHKNFIEEVSIKPKELVSVEKSILGKLSEAQCNQTCTHDELEIVKKNINYIQKQIENIYTLLERNTKKSGA